jgi:hypothetical protein
MVYDEIVKGETPTDELAQWIKSRRQSGLFVPPDRHVQEAEMRTVADYVQSKYEQYHVADFLGGADPWLIAHALNTGGVVVTHESRRHPNAKKVRIPDVCAALHVRCNNVFDMLETLGADFRQTNVPKKRGR